MRFPLGPEVLGITRKREEEQHGMKGEIAEPEDKHGPCD